MLSSSFFRLPLVISFLLVFICVSADEDDDVSSKEGEFELLADDYNLEQNIPIQGNEYSGAAWYPPPSIRSSCYDPNGKAKMCMPEFSNAAAYRVVDTTNTCGAGPKGAREFCRQMETPRARGTGQCEPCDLGVPGINHPAVHMTDFNTLENLTWWMSETMEDGTDYPGQVNVTLDLGKSYDISYVRLRFYSSRPESFAVYKRTRFKEDEDDPEWVPYQYYSGSCEETYGLPEGGIVTRFNETTAICTSEYSDISPLTGGTVLFSTLEGRPSAYEFENNPKLQEFVIATAIRITLDKINTFGDEIFEDPLVLKSYYYAISDFSIGARCRCYGHATACVWVPDEDADEEELDQEEEEELGTWHRSLIKKRGKVKLVCRCEHNTMGQDCDQCLPLYNERPWEPALIDDARECLPCNCNGKSSRCFFDQELFERTGQGGHCLECRDNTEGVHCERCQPMHFRRAEDRECVACSCHHVGSLGVQCDERGQCPCKIGVGTRTCSKCAPNFYDMTAHGCKPCGCNLAGIAKDAPTCDPALGACPCKQNVVGQRCDKCKSGFFDLQESNEFGCVPCFCYGHSNECQGAPNFYKKIIESTFDADNESWTATDLRGREIPIIYDADLQLIEVRGESGEFAYFVAPACYLGDRLTAYNQYLTFTLRIGAESVRVSAHDLILEGGGLRVSVPITEQGNPIPSHRVQNYKFRLHEHPDFGWTPRLSAFDFGKILANLTAIKIKATYSREGIGFLDDIILESAFRTPGNYQATWVEHCACPEGYVGLSCESCARGYRREIVGNGLYARCVRCFCHGHADNCDPDTGQCECKHNAEGHNCGRCAPGYHGNAQKGTPGDCRPCLCPDHGPCVVLPGGHVACQQCPLGHTGHQCELCIDGYFGDPLGRSGPPRPCRKCECSGNIDPNAVGNCNTTTGQCLKCIYNTIGWNCDRCLPGFSGSALATPKGGCKRCTCYLPGSIVTDRHDACDTRTGDCKCKANVAGRRCEKCRKGFWNIDSGHGCQPCECNRVGSYNQTCDIRSGQCYCRPGVTGKRCDACAPYHYGFSDEGCQACECDPTGSVSLQCDTTGQCQCRPNREGRRCTVCRDNKYSKGTVCIDCPPCYTLLEEAMDRYKDKLTELANLMQELKNHPEDVDDLDFQRQLRQIMRKVDDLMEDAKRAGLADANLLNQLADLRRKIRLVQETAGKVTEKLAEGDDHRRDGVQNITLAENVIAQAQDAVAAARKYLDTQGRDAYNSALDKADKMGQQSDRLSEIARQARQLADQQEEDAEVILTVSDEALNTSTEAYRLARETFDSNERMSKAVSNLAKKLDDLSDFMERTKMLGEDAKKEAGNAYEEALDIYTDANSIPVPRADVQAMKGEATKIKAEARRIKAEADDLAKENKGRLMEIEEKSEDAQGLLEEAIRQQQITDELLTDTDAALAKAQDAIASGEQILDDARDTLETLKGFDQQVQESKGKADEALKKAPHVEKMNQEAAEKTFQAEDALGGAKQDAYDARDMAKEAKRIAEQASVDADGIRKEAGETKQGTKKLQGQAEDLDKKIGATDQRMKGFEEEAKNDAALAKGALERANEAKTSAVEASTKAKNAAEMLDDILDALGDLDSVDSAQLEDLERLLALAEHELRQADLPNRAQALREAQAEQQVWMKDYEDEIEQLKKDVANVAAIRYSLPDDCYRRLVLEP